MKWFSETWKTIRKALGVRRFVFGTVITLAVTVFHSLGTLFPSLLDIPTWAVAVIAGLSLFVFFLLQYATSLSTAAEPKFQFGGDGKQEIEVLSYDPGRRGYNLSVKNNSLQALRQCRFVLTDMRGPDGRNKISRPLDLHYPMPFSPMERQPITLLTIVDDAEPNSFVVNHFFRNAGRWLQIPSPFQLPSDSYSLTVEAISDDTAPLAIRLVTTKQDGKWVLIKAPAGP